MNALPEHTTTWFQLPNAPGEGTHIAMLDEVVNGSIQLYDFGSDAKPFRLLLLRSGERVLGYVNRCAHFGVPLAATGKHLIFTPYETLSCNVHYARYRWEDGACASGECAGEGLIPVPLKVIEGRVVFGDWARP